MVTQCVEFEHLRERQPPPRFSVRVIIACDSCSQLLSTNQRAEHALVLKPQTEQGVCYLPHCEALHWSARGERTGIVSPGA